MTTLHQDIDALYDGWCRAFARRDVDAVLSLVTDDYVLWAPGRPPLGREALRPMLLAAFEAYDIEMSFEREELLVAGDLAVDRGWDCQTVRPRTGGPARTQRQRVFVVLGRTADGQWKFARGMSQPGPDASE